MPKQVIVSMEENYPFGECEEVSNENTRVLVRKIYEVGLQEQNSLLQKVGVLRKLRNEHMIKIESVLQEEESVHFMFEYIPIKLETWISNINDQFIENFRDQLIKFSSFLANHNIKIDFQLRNIGMDQDYGAKYFLDLDFQVHPNLNREKLKSTYIREITNLFKPYLTNSQKVHHSLDSDREIVSVDYTAQKAFEVEPHHDTSISPPTNRAQAKNKEKALQKYYQEVNMSVDSENQKILQEFMDVLDNEEEEHAKPHKNSIPKPKEHPKQTPKNVPPTEAYSHKIQSYSQKQIVQPYSKKEAVQPEAVRHKKSTVSEIVPSRQVAGAKEVQKVEEKREIGQMGHMGQVGHVGHNKGWSQSVQEVREGGQMWRSSTELQDRVRKAIEKSIDVIKKFKSIKQNN